MLARYVNWLARLPRTWSFAVGVMVFIWVLALFTPLWVANVFIGACLISGVAVLVHEWSKRRIKADPEQVLPHGGE